MPVAEVVGGAQQVERRPRVAGGDDEHRLRRAPSPRSASRLRRRARRRRARRWPRARNTPIAAPVRIDAVEAALLPRVPVELDRRGAAHERRREAAAAGDQLAGDEQWRCTAAARIRTGSSAAPSAARSPARRSAARRRRAPRRSAGRPRSSACASLWTMSRLPIVRVLLHRAPACFVRPSCVGDAGVERGLRHEGHATVVSAPPKAPNIGR